jgi:hypothetical protein
VRGSPRENLDNQVELAGYDSPMRDVVYIVIRYRLMMGVGEFMIMLAIENKVICTKSSQCVKYCTTSMSLIVI